MEGCKHSSLLLTTWGSFVLAKGTVFRMCVVEVLDASVSRENVAIFVWWSVAYSVIEDLTYIAAVL